MEQVGSNVFQSPIKKSLTFRVINEKAISKIIVFSLK